MNYTALTFIGILIGILIFGIKTGLGCGFSNVTTKEILTIGGSYFFLALLFGSVADRISLDAFERLSSLGMGIHILVALILIGTGIYTQKKRNAGKDVTRHTFLIISMPCPICLGALALSCMLLVSTLEISGLKIGLLIGSAFFTVIIGSSLLFRKLGKTPETLGGIMLTIGVYYLLGIMIIPAYMQTKQMNVASTGGGETGLIPLLVCAAIVLLSFLLANLRRHDQ
jgi:predicted transporter